MANESRQLALSKPKDHLHTFFSYSSFHSKFICYSDQATQALQFVVFCRCTCRHTDKVAVAIGEVAIPVGATKAAVFGAGSDADLLVTGTGTTTFFVGLTLFTGGCDDRWIIILRQATTSLALSTALTVLNFLDSLTDRQGSILGGTPVLLTRHHLVLGADRLIRDVQVDPEGLHPINHSVPVVSRETRGKNGRHGTLSHIYVLLSYWNKLIYGFLWHFHLELLLTL